MAKEHQYRTTVQWTGNQGSGTSGYQTYLRDHSISSPGKIGIPGSSDPSFRGDPTRYNPEELLLASLSACHMLWYLHLCADSGIVVMGYEDDAEGIMDESQDGSGKFREVILNPHVIVKNDEMVEKAMGLHTEAHQKCFIANSVNFPVRHAPSVRSEDH